MRECERVESCSHWLIVQSLNLACDYISHFPLHLRLYNITIVCTLVAASYLQAIALEVRACNGSMTYEYDT